MTPSIMTISIKSLSIMTLSIMTLCIITLNIMTLCIMTLDTIEGTTEKVNGRKSLTEKMKSLRLFGDLSTVQFKKGYFQGKIQYPCDMTPVA
jgi:hypothetical protein